MIEWIILAVILGMIIIVAGWLIGCYNTLVTGKQDVKGRWANICTELQRRADLFLNLAANVKSHKLFEKETLVGVAAARSGLQSGTQSKQMNAAMQMKKMFGILEARVESYPQLQSSALFKEFMTEIRISEDRLNVARTEYNGYVEDFNTYLNLFPTVLIARMLGFTNETYFLNEESTNKISKVDV